MVHKFTKPQYASNLMVFYPRTFKLTSKLTVSNIVNSPKTLNEKAVIRNFSENNKSIEPKNQIVEKLSAYTKKQQQKALHRHFIQEGFELYSKKEFISALVFFEKAFDIESDDNLDCFEGGYWYALTLLNTNQKISAYAVLSVSALKSPNEIRVKRLLQMLKYLFDIEDGLKLIVGDSDDSKRQRILLLENRVQILKCLLKESTPPSGWK